VPPKYLRRLISVPLVAVALVVAVVLMPIWLPLTALADIVTGPRRLRYTRLGYVVVLLLINEIRTLLLCLVLWLRCGVGTTVRTAKGQHRMQRVLHTYGTGLVTATRRALGVQIQTTGLDESLAAGGPILVFVRHTSLMDSALPVDLVGGRDFGLRYVIKQSLSLAPAFDIGGHLLPIHFANRSGNRTSEQMESITRLAKGMTGREAFVVFPEGTFYNERRQRKAIERLHADAPHLVERALRLRHTLPPRGGGALALLAGAPTADVVFMAHAGLESFNTIPNIVRHVPLPNPVRIDFWRVPRSEIPTDPSAQYDWLFGQFERVDQFVIEQLDGPITTSGEQQPSCTV
jgi:1-acyl-sn-glycerol-3-phosphate acyltransferase